MGSKIHSGGVLGGQAEKKTFFNASRTPQGPLLGSHVGVQNRSKPVPEAFPRRIWHRRAFWNGFGTLWRLILKHFLKPPRDRSRNKRDKTEEVKIFQNTSVFTVRLHLRNVDNARTTLAETFFFSICHWYASGSVSGPHLGLDLGTIWAGIKFRIWILSKIRIQNTGSNNYRLVMVSLPGILGIEIASAFLHQMSLISGQKFISI